MCQTGHVQFDLARQTSQAVICIAIKTEPITKLARLTSNHSKLNTEMFILLRPDAAYKYIYFKALMSYKFLLSKPFCNMCVIYTMWALLTLSNFFYLYMFMCFRAKTIIYNKSHKRTHSASCCYRLQRQAEKLKFYWTSSIWSSFSENPQALRDSFQTMVGFFTPFSESA